MVQVFLHFCQYMTDALSRAVTKLVHAPPCPDSKSVARRGMHCRYICLWCRLHLVLHELVIGIGSVWVIIHHLAAVRIIQCSQPLCVGQKAFEERLVVAMCINSTPIPPRLRTQNTSMGTSMTSVQVKLQTTRASASKTVDACSIVDSLRLLPCLHDEHKTEELSIVRGNEVRISIQHLARTTSIFLL